ncbi:MAG: SPASM domain-containing protein [Lachnospirales bacterium]
MTINNNGDICPCTLLPLTVGNIEDKPLTDILRV